MKRNVVTMVVACGLLVAVFGAAAAAQSAKAIELKAPGEASAGAEIDVSYGGETQPIDFISIDRPGAPDEEYGSYAYVKSGNPVKLRAPDVPGDYQIRYHRSTPGYTVAGSSTLTVKDVSASIEGPAEVEAGATFEVKFQGPDTKGDFVSVDKAAAADRDYGTYVYTNKGSPAKLRAPDQPGSYEVRYHLGQTYRVVARHPLAVGGSAVTLDAPANVRAGGEIEVAWTGPNNPNDFVSVDTAGAADRDYGTYGYTKDGSPLKLRAPEEAGEYAIRYHTGQTYTVLATRALRVDAATATVEGPAAVETLAKFEVAWTGPGNPEDYIALAAPDDPGQSSAAYAYTKRGNPARLQAPKQSGTYELRYVTGQKNLVLARAAMEVKPGTAPGRLRVTASAGKEPSYGAVELILDASGSMLQRLGGERRIDLAKAALTELTRDVLPAGAPFALRVFGHREANSCRTDLEIALSPLDRNAALAKIRGIESKNLAKTPIGDSLLRVKEDLAGVEGGAVVVLVTDGEETCGGDPKAAIGTLRGAGIDVRVNIVGFAIDELALAEEFEAWAKAGAGSYFDARDGKALASAMRAALRQPYAVEKNGATVATGVVNGEPLELPPGSYQVKVLSNPAKSLGEVTIEAGGEVKLDAE
jgi:hypothetical protein